MKRISQKAIKDVLKKMSENVKERVKDKDKLKSLLDEAVQKAKDTQSIKGPFDELLEKLQLLFSVLKDYIGGSYKEIPIGSIIAIAAGLLYFVTPADLIADTTPVVGYIDDLYVITHVVKQIYSDLEKYKAWKAGAAAN